jgi:hypothetical protein
MKVAHLIITILFVLSLTNCTPGRYITERYIKTKIESHTEGQFTTIKTKKFTGVVTVNKNAYIEFTGVKNGNEKLLVIGTDRNYKMRRKFKLAGAVLNDLVYVELTEVQCKTLLENFNKMKEKKQSASSISPENLYNDFTLTPEIFISCRKISPNNNIESIDLWLKGEKYSLEKEDFTYTLQKFIDY